MSEAPAIFLRPRPRNYALTLFGAPFTVMSFAIIGFLFLAVLGMDLGVHFSRETQPTFNERVLVGLALFVFLLLIVYIGAMLWLIAFARFSWGRSQGPGMFELRPLFRGSWVGSRYDELIGYSECSLPSLSIRGGGGRGLALYHRNGSHVQLNETTVEGLPEFRDMLDRYGVRFLGRERCWWYPFMKRRFKFDPS